MYQVNNRSHNLQDMKRKRTGGGYIEYFDPRYGKANRRIRRQRKKMIRSMGSE
mgnify:CR=1 FL=1